MQRRFQVSGMQKKAYSYKYQIIENLVRRDVFSSLSLSLSLSLFVAPSQRSLKVDNFHIEWHQVEKSGIKINGRGNHKTVKIKFVAIFPTRKLVRS